jgi:transglycosylase-like protein with SLT domain
MLFSLGPFSRKLVSGAVAAATLSFTCAAPAHADASEASSGTTVIARYADALGTANARLPRAVRRDLAERVLLLSSYYKLDPCLLGALVSVESAWRSRAVSPVGAIGYGQLMPGTAATLDVNALEPYENLDGTARYLRRMLNRFAGRDLQTRMQLALASYNAGPAAVARYSGMPPYRETRAYVSNVLRTRRAFVAAVAPRPRPAAAASSHRTQATHSPRIAAAAAHSARVAKLAALDARIVGVETPRPVRYETSRSFVARFLGLRHRVSPTASTPDPTVPDVH